MATFTHQNGEFFPDQGANIYYEEAGNSSGPAVLFLHGGFGTLEDFEPIIDSFLNEFRVIAMDGRGQGKSTLGDAQLTYQLMASDVVRLLDHLKIKSASLVGFSDGGMVAHLVSIADPARVEKLISIAAPWSKSDLDAIREFLLKVTTESWREKFPESYNLYKSLNPSLDFDKLVDQIRSMWVDETESGGYPGEVIAKISNPILVIRGDNDKLVSRQSAFDLVSKIKNSQWLNIPFAGHEVYKEESTIVAETILKFLKSQPKKS